MEGTMQCQGGKCTLVKNKADSQTSGGCCKQLTNTQTCCKTKTNSSSVGCCMNDKTSQNSKTKNKCCDDGDDCEEYNEENK